ncbi:MAG: alanine--tRNA ligase [Deferribacteraceae bacterium]|jgi:alanyl-tRNA synthetase|nr:alanine--tRNA ligase [Deferribacteraceae bacterium]
MTGSDIRAAFLKYFEERGHTAVSSSSLVPHDDPTLLFANAGMNQFKDIFLGKATRSYNRATSCQKVVRAGGKHNDLENVGRTSRHHTFFEMLGNFSFGDYFKKDAIVFAWDFLTNVLHLPAEKMFVTIYLDDDEAHDIWRDVVGLPEDKILRKDEKDNFWQMGDTGPCGPCSEIHIDQGPNTGCGRPECSPDCDCDRHLELWNLVFMQYNRDINGTLHLLPKPSIDTGMGLERVASVVQKVTSNYDTDLILPIIDYAATMAGVHYGENEATDVSLRVLADHARSTTFLVADGVLPSGEARGSVLRRIMRRAMRHGNALGMDDIFFYQLCGFVIDFMKGHYVELADKKDFVEKIVMTEEEAFSRTLNNGMRVIREDIIEKLPSGCTVSGEIVFKMYDTLGFPADLCDDILTDAGFSVDMEGFRSCMARQQEMAKRAGLSSGTSAVSDIIKQVASKHKSEFKGYDSLEIDATVLAIISDGKEVESVSNGADVEIILDVTPFYPEGGGQTGDYGTIFAPFGNNLFAKHIEIVHTYKVEGSIVHRGRVIDGTITKGMDVFAKVDSTRRNATQRNHTATHLLHKALQTVLGPHARQAGSSVTPDGLRFDFTHTGQLSPAELQKITEMVNAAIYDGRNVTKELKSQEEAVKGGATALFGEKYGDTVRVVTVCDYSQELCGGCHVDNTAQIGLFVIVSEAGIAAGTRRIEALTGAKANEYLMERSRIVAGIMEQLKVQHASELELRIMAITEQLKEHEKALKAIKERESAREAMQSLKAARNINGVDVVVAKLADLSAEELRNVVDGIINDMKTQAIVLVGSVTNDKVSLVCRVTPDLVGKYKAGALIREVAKIVGGSGGGRDDMAQAGGKEPAKLDEALEAVYGLIG